MLLDMATRLALMEKMTVEAPTAKEAGTDMTITFTLKEQGQCYALKSQYESYFTFFLPEERVIFHSGIPNTESAYCIC